MQKTHGKVPLLPMLVGVSGGADSVVLCHLLKRSGFSFSIAHCNFNLRGKDSEQDEQFVTDLADQLSVQCYKIDFDTKNISTKEKSSIQLVARKLRYEWFELLRKKHAFGQIATAHHLNDRIETFLYNFAKGTGIRGLRSIEAQTGHIIRPLLFASKADILTYAKNNKLDFREDTSNLSLKYSRNKIRIEAVPVLQSINPALEKTALSTFENLEDTEQLFLWAMEQHKKDLLKVRNEETYIDFGKLKTGIAPKTVLYELLSPFGFTIDQIKNVLSESTRNSGAQFFSTTHRMLTNREELIITDIEKKQYESVFVFPEDKTAIFSGHSLKISYTSTLPNQYPTDPNIAWLDFAKLVFPLVIRSWKEGDYFCPIGMGGRRQKLKKFFTNQKASLVEKEKTRVLLSNGEICWVIGWRVDERFKVEEGTKLGGCFSVLKY